MGEVAKKPNQALTAEQILGTAGNLRRERVDVPEWGGHVFVRELTGKERDEYETSIVSIGPDGQPKMHSENMRAKLAALSIVNESGERVFTTKQAAALGDLSAAALDRVLDTAKTLSRIGEDELEAVGKD